MIALARSRGLSVNPVVVWSVIGIAGFAVLPWYGLEYGLVESTWDEIFDALAWRSANLSLLPLAAFILYLFRPWRGLAEITARRLDLWVAGLTISGIIVGANFDAGGLGLGAAVQLTALGGIMAMAFARLGYVRGDACMTGAIILIVATVVLFIFFPVTTIFIKVLFDRAGAFAPLQFFAIATEFGTGRVFMNSVFLALCVGVSSTFFGLVFALYTVRSMSRYRNVIKIFSILPIITPPFVIGLALILIFGRSGSINDILEILFGAGGLFIPEGGEPLFRRSGYIYGFFGIFLAQTLSFSPISFMLLLGMVSTINPSLEEASLTMRADQWETFRWVTFPLLRPGIANSFLLGVIESLADFGNPLVLGGDYDVLSTEIYFSIAGAQLDFARAATLGIMLLSVSLTCFLLQKLWIGKKSYVTVTGKGSGGDVMPLPRLLERGCGVIVFIWIAFNVIIYSSIVVGGFVATWGADYTPTLRYYDELWGRGLRSGGWPSYINTIVFATVAAPLTAFMGILIAYVTTRRRFRGRAIIDFGSMISFAIPGTVIGVSYIIAFNTPPIEITGSALILIICFVFRNMPVGIRAGISALSQIDQSLEEASLTQRAGTFRTVFSVVLPLLRPAIMSACVYSFIRSITSVSAVIFLVTAETNVGTTYILARVEDGDYGVSVAYGTVLIVTMLAVTILINLVIGKSRVERQMALE